MENYAKLCKTMQNQNLERLSNCKIIHTIIQVQPTVIGNCIKLPTREKCDLAVFKKIELHL